MRSIWKGAIGFGLVSVPVRLYAATEDHDISLHQVHDADSGRIRYARTCENCGQVVPFENIVRAYVDGDTTVVLADDDLASLPVERTKEITIVTFVPLEQVDPLMYERTYFLEPEKSGLKAYELLARTLDASSRLAVATMALRQRTRLAAVRVRSGVLTVQTMHWADEIREMPQPQSGPELSDAELDMSARLVDAYSGDFAPETFVDEYQVELQALIDAKLARGEAIQVPDTGTAGASDGKVIDLMEALRQSVERSRADKTPRRRGKTAS